MLQASSGGDPPVPVVPVVAAPPKLPVVLEGPTEALPPELPLLPDVVLEAPPTLLLLLLLTEPTSVPLTLDTDATLVSDPAAVAMLVPTTLEDEVVLPAVVAVDAALSAGSLASPQPTPAIPTSTRRKY